MKHSLLAWLLPIAAGLPLELEAQTTELVADTVCVSVGTQNHMFIKAFSQPIKDYLEQHPRIAIEFTSADATVVEDGGAWFRGKTTGKAKVMLTIYQESTKFKDYPDYEKKLDELSFVVKVEDQVPATLPTMLTDWGLGRAEVAQAMTDKLYEDFNATFATMNPGMTEEELSYYDIYYTDDYEYPLVYNMFNEEGQLVSTYTLVNNATRLGYMAESEITQALEPQGYELLGYDEMGWPVLYNEATKTQAYGGVLTIQGQYFRMLGLEYCEENPLGITHGQLPMPTATITKQNGTLHIDATGQAGQTVRIYGAGGKLLDSRTLHEGDNAISLDTHQPVIVKIGQTMGVKVM